MRICSACVLMLTGCVSSPSAPAAYEPLVCDPANGDHIAFAVQESGAFNGPAPALMHGNHFLIVDGACRFYRSSGLDARRGVVSSGTLSAEQVDAINAELMTAPWAAIDGEHRFDVIGADGSSISLWRDDFGASCYQDCSQATPQLQSILAIALDWEAELAASATPMDGPLRLVVEDVSFDDAIPWEGATSITASLPGPYGGTTVVSNPDDTILLRELRAGITNIDGAAFVREGDDAYRILILDVMPHVNEQGQFRPPFPLHT